MKEVGILSFIIACLVAGCGGGSNEETREAPGHYYSITVDGNPAGQAMLIFDLTGMTCIEMSYYVVLPEAVLEHDAFTVHSAVSDQSVEWLTEEIEGWPMEELGLHVFQYEPESLMLPHFPETEQHQRFIAMEIESQREVYGQDGGGVTAQLPPIQADQFFAGDQTDAYSWGRDQFYQAWGQTAETICEEVSGV